MDKLVLKSALDAVKVEDIIELNFVGDFKNLNGKYKILKIGTGKGKGGSIILEIMNTVTGERLNTLTMANGKKHFLGTPVSEHILNITIDGKFHGVKTESELPKAFLRTKEAGSEIRHLLNPLINRTTPTKLAITSTKAPEFNGTWLVENVKLNAGRYGQISLKLVDVNDSNRVIMLWSYRHGAVIDSIEEVV